MSDGLAVSTMALCAGLGVTERAVNRVIPTRLVVAVERQAYCAAALVARMEEASVDRASLGRFPIWDDLCTFDGRPWHGRVDLVVTGFPCQPASVAGKRSGTSDERWLWPHVARIIDECGAPMLFLENVPGLLSVNSGGAFLEILEFMAARGWSAQWDCVPAGTVGAPHVRDRLFLLAADTNRIDVRQLAERHQRQGWRVRATERGDGEHVHDGADRSTGRAGQRDAAERRREQWRRWIDVTGRPAPRPSVSRMGDGHAGGLERDSDAYDPDRDWADRIHAIGNSVVEEAAAVAFAILLERLCADRTESPTEPPEPRASAIVRADDRPVANEASMSKRKSKSKKPKRSKKKQEAEPADHRPMSIITDASRKTCPNCGEVHMGDSEEALAALDPEAAVFYDRDVAENARSAGLCGPRFRLSGGRLHAHYGSPAGLRPVYVVFVWDPVTKSWGILIDTLDGLDRGSFGRIRPEPHG